MTHERVFIVGEHLTWNCGPYEEANLRCLIARGEAPEHPVVVAVKSVDNKNHCPVCGSTDLTVGHRSWRIDGSPDGCEWGGTFPHPQYVKLQVGSDWWNGDWFI
jgi:hypothetical protein